MCYTGRMETTLRGSALKSGDIIVGLALNQGNDPAHTLYPRSFIDPIRVGSPQWAMRLGPMHMRNLLVRVIPAGGTQH